VFETDESDSKMMLAKNVQLIYLSENKFFLPKGLFCFLLDVVVVVAAAAVVVVAVVVVDCNESKQKWLEVVWTKNIVGERIKDNEGGQILITSNDIEAATKIKWKIC
jgi:hypothetical protein